MTPETVYEYLKVRAWIFFLLYASLLIFLSHQPGDPTRPLPFPHFDKVQHLVGYFVFGFFFRRAIYFTNLEKKDAWVLLGTLLFAISDEIHQSYIPNRSADALDVVADLCGAILGLFFFRGITRFLKMPKKPESPLNT